MKEDIIKYYSELDKHYESIWGKRIMEIKWMKGPYTSLPANFHTSVYVVDETTNVIITSGLSLCKTNERIEFFLYFKPDMYIEARLAELLTSTAYFHCTQGVLSVGHIFNWGESIIYKSPLKRGYLSWPYIEDKKIESFQNVKIFWLIPITETEHTYAIKNGIDKLEKLFEEKELNYIDFERKSLC
ncbi:suppressor of fused domain protein [Treponema socranskii]|jgi:hypothetical protein|uniref:suppressor of fused domain protein n=1 Tax=Treponema socranskii TaxID=53419 RepID=UPI003D93DBFB